MTNEEKSFLVNLLSQVTINASDPKAEETVNLVKSIIKKLKEEYELSTKNN